MDIGLIFKEIKFRAVRASGSGGQHVNKVSTKVELSFDLMESEAFSDEEKFRLQEKLRNRISKDGKLIIQSQDSRSQIKNKKDAKSKLLALLRAALIVPKKRRKTLPSKKVKEKRLKSKKLQSEKKAYRQKPEL